MRRKWELVGLVGPMVLLGAWCGGVLVSRHVDPAQSRSAAMAEREWRPAQVASWRES